MIQIQWFQAVLMLLGLVVSSVVVVASYAKSNREQQDKNKEVWEEAVKALDTYNHTLKEQLESAEKLQQKTTAELGVLQGSLQQLQWQIEKDKRSWTDRNQRLYDRCQAYRAQLERLGVNTPEPNGDG